MMLYCARFTDRVTGKVMHKIGHTKWGPNKFHNRFDYPEYQCFDIELLSYAIISHTDWNVAKTAIITAENMIRAIIPPKDPSFMIEDYFERPPGSMKLSGVTEMVFLKESQTEEQLVNMFNRFSKAIVKTNLELTEKIK